MIDCHSQIFSQRPVQKEATELCTQLLTAFAPCLEELAFTKTSTNAPEIR